MNRIAALTPRERQVLLLVALGMTNIEIHQELVISVKTVERHLYNIYQKLGVSSRTQAVMYLLAIGARPAIEAWLKTAGFLDGDLKVSLKIREFLDEETEIGPYNL